METPKWRITTNLANLYNAQCLFNTEHFVCFNELSCGMQRQGNLRRSISEYECNYEIPFCYTAGHNNKYFVSSCTYFAAVIVTRNLRAQRYIVNYAFFNFIFYLFFFLFLSCKDNQKDTTLGAFLTFGNFRFVVFHCDQLTRRNVSDRAPYGMAHIEAAKGRVDSHSHGVGMTIMRSCDALSTTSARSAQRPQVNRAMALAIADANAQGMTAMKIGSIKSNVKRKNGQK